MEVDSILSLNDDCLCNIVSYIRDPSSFNSLTRTCKRLRQLTSKTRNSHIDIVRSKAEYFLKRLVVYLGSSYGKQGPNYEAYKVEFHKLKELVDEAAQYSSTRCVLTYDKVVDVWETSGPVASEVFRWIRKRSSSYCFKRKIRYSSLTIHLPRGNQEMTINTSYFHEYTGISPHELIIGVKYGDTKIVERVYDLYVGESRRPKDFKNWSEKEVKEFFVTMKPVTDLLQEELGETIPSIRGNFLLWFLCFFPGEISLDEEDKLIFKDAAKNEKPSIKSTQPVLNYVQENLLSRFQTASARWIDNTSLTEDLEIGTCKSVVESLDVLVQRFDSQFLNRKIQGDISHIFDVTKKFIDLPEKLMLALVKRTLFEREMYFSSTASFCLPKSQFIQVQGDMSTSAGRNVHFHLPDNKKIHLNTGDVYFYPRCKEEKVLDIRHLSPITKLLQECINHSMEGEEKIPKIKDMFTAVYFIRILDCQGQFEEHCTYSDEFIVEED